jgi:hypothetical protein
VKRANCVIKIFMSHHHHHLSFLFFHLLSAAFICPVCRARFISGGLGRLRESFVEINERDYICMCGGEDFLGSLEFNSTFSSPLGSG